MREDVHSETCRLPSRLHLLPACQVVVSSAAKEGLRTLTDVDISTRSRCNASRCDELQPIRLNEEPHTPTGASSHNAGVRKRRGKSGRRMRRISTDVQIRMNADNVPILTSLALNKGLINWGWNDL